MVWFTGLVALVSLLGLPVGEPAYAAAEPKVLLPYVPPSCERGLAETGGQTEGELIALGDPSRLPPRLKDTYAGWPEYARTLYDETFASLSVRGSLVVSAMHPKAWSLSKAFLADSPSQKFLIELGRQIAQTLRVRPAIVSVTSATATDGHKQLTLHYERLRETVAFETTLLMLTAEGEPPPPFVTSWFKNFLTFADLRHSDADHKIFLSLLEALVADAALSQEEGLGKYLEEHALARDRLTSFLLEWQQANDCLLWEP